MLAVRHIVGSPDYDVTDSGRSISWRREPARLDPDGNAKAYWMVARWVSRSMRSMKVPIISDAPATSPAMSVSGSVTNLRISSSGGLLSAAAFSASALRNRSLSTGNVLSVKTTVVISVISRRLSWLALKVPVQEFRHEYRVSGCWVNVIPLPHCAQARRPSRGNTGVVAVIMWRSFVGGVGDGVYLHCKAATRVLWGSVVEASVAVRRQGGFTLEEKFNELELPEDERATLVYLRVSAEGQVQHAVAYLRVAAESIAALVEQQNNVQRFADANGYTVDKWYVEGPGVQLEGGALSRLLADLVSEGREFTAVLVWDYARLARNASRLSEILDVLRVQGVQLVSVSDHTRFAGLERQLAELTGALDDEVAG